MSRLLQYRPIIWTPLVILVDFVTKRLVLANAEILQRKVNVIGDLLRFSYVRNPGAAMDLIPVGRGVLITISIVATIFLTVLYKRTAPDQVVRRSAIAAILGGAIGNLIDRIFYDGLVVDFIDIGIGAHRFYTFNVADMAVTIGGCILFLSLILESHPGQEPSSGIEPLEDSESSQES